MPSTPASSRRGNTPPGFAPRQMSQNTSRLIMPMANRAQNSGWLFTSPSCHSPSTLAGTRANSANSAVSIRVGR